MLCATPATLAPAFARSALPRERVRSLTDAVEKGLVIVGSIGKL
jgi:hypothetical protein